MPGAVVAIVLILNSDDISSIKDTIEYIMFISTFGVILLLAFK